VVRAWGLDAPVRYVRCVGGPAGREGLLTGLRSGAVLMLFIDRDAPVPLFSHDAPVRCARSAPWPARTKAQSASEALSSQELHLFMSWSQQGAQCRQLPERCKVDRAAQQNVCAVKRGAAQRCLDLSAGRGRVAVVDDASVLSVYCLASAARVWGAPGAASAAWNTACDDMLAWSGGGALCMRTADFPPHRQPLQARACPVDADSLPSSM